MVDGFKRLNEHNIAELDFLLNSHTDTEDSLLGSTAYLLLTARHGLWVARDLGTYLLVCRHPNRPRQFLVLPPTHGFDPYFAKSTCERIIRQGVQVTLGRIQRKHDIILSTLPCFVKEKERILDWKHPCVILDNKAVSESKGGKFASFRQKTNKIKGSKITSIRVNRHDHQRHRSEAKFLIEKWARDVAKKGLFRFEELVEPNLYAYDMSQFSLENFYVDLIFYDEKPIALYTTEHSQRSNVANGISLSVDRNVKGASEYAYLHTVRRHMEAGYKYTNINGAETESLNEFRNKLNPVKRIVLSTYRYKG